LCWRIFLAHLSWLPSAFLSIAQHLQRGGGGGGGGGGGP